MFPRSFAHSRNLRQSWPPNRGWTGGFLRCLAPRPAALALLIAIASLSAAQTIGVPNFHKVDEHVYRGAQPTEEGFRSLAQLGIKMVIDLRGSEHSIAAEKKVVEADGMRYVSIPMRGMTSPTDEQISSALKLLKDESGGPVFVHCRRGADRTGAVIACYRISHDQWNRSKALDEANRFGMSRFEVAIRHYVARYAPKDSVPLGSGAN